MGANCLFLSNGESKQPDDNIVQCWLKSLDMLRLPSIFVFTMLSYFFDEDHVSLFNEIQEI